MVRALALALLPFLADAAYECSGGYKLTGNASTTYCGGLYECGSSECCVDDATKCGNPSTIMSCWNHTGKTYTPGATGTTQAECCVVDQAKCSSMTCDTSMGKKSTASAADSYCMGATCTTDSIQHPTSDSITCCEVDNTTCAYFSVVPGCGTGKSVPTSKYGTTGSTVAACCEDDVAPTTAKCSTYGCTMESSAEGIKAQFYEPDTTKANVEFSSDDSEDVKTNKCCKIKSHYCIVAVQAAVGGKANFCATGKTPKMTNSGSTAAECCVDDHTCSTHVPEPSGTVAARASSANGLEWAPVLLVTNALALSRLF